MAPPNLSLVKLISDFVTYFSKISPFFIYKENTRVYCVVLGLKNAPEKSSDYKSQNYGLGMRNFPFVQALLKKLQIYYSQEPIKMRSFTGTSLFL